MARTKEGSFQDSLIRLLEDRVFPGCLVQKQDESYRQGFPDLIVILPGGFVAVLEVKKSGNEPYRPNQEYFLNYCKDLGHFTATIYPENMEEVIYELQQALQPRGKTRLPRW